MVLVEPFPIPRAEDNRPKPRSARRTVELHPDTLPLLELIRPLHIEPTMPVFVNIAGRQLDQRTFKTHWDDCLRSLGIRQRGVYSTKDTFVTMALLAGVKPAWLEQQTGVDYTTLRRHYGRWMSGEVASEMQKLTALVRPSSAPKVFPLAAGSRGHFPTTFEIQAVTKWSQGDSNPCYRRERPAS